MKEGFSRVIIGSMLRIPNGNFCIYNLEWASTEEKLYSIFKLLHHRLNVQESGICSYLNFEPKCFLSVYISM